MNKSIAVLNAVVDRVLAYRPKSKRRAAKKEKSRKNPRQKDAERMRE